MEIGYRDLLPTNPNCEHRSIVWDVLKTLPHSVRVKVTCLGCRKTGTGTVNY